MTKRHSSSAVATSSTLDEEGGGGSTSATGGTGRRRLVELVCQLTTCCLCRVGRNTLRMPSLLRLAPTAPRALDSASSLPAACAGMGSLPDWVGPAAWGTPARGGAPQGRNQPEGTLWLSIAARWLMPTPGVFAPSKLGISRSAHSVPRCCARAHAISDGLVAPRAACEWQGKENKSHREQWHARRQYNDHLALQGTADPFDHGGRPCLTPCAVTKGNGEPFTQWKRSETIGEHVRP